MRTHDPEIESCMSSDWASQVPHKIVFREKYYKPQNLPDVFMIKPYGSLTLPISDLSWECTWTQKQVYSKVFGDGKDRGDASAWFTPLQMMALNLHWNQTFNPNVPLQLVYSCKARLPIFQKTDLKRLRQEIQELSCTPIGFYKIAF